MALKPLAIGLQAASRPALDRRGRALAALIAQWASIVGERLAEQALPEKLSAGLLTLRVGSGAALDVHYALGPIIERINAALGHKAVQRIRMIQAPLPVRPMAPRTSRARPRVVHKSGAGRLEAALADLEHAITLEDSANESVGYTTSGGQDHVST